MRQAREHGDRASNAPECPHQHQIADERERTDGAELARRETQPQTEQEED
jgi:hypothetical protein